MFLTGNEDNLVFGVWGRGSGKTFFVVACQVLRPFCLLAHLINFFFITFTGEALYNPQVSLSLTLETLIFIIPSEPLTLDEAFSLLSYENAS